jgi:hypothetical protein
MHLLRAPSFAMLLLLLIVPSGWSQYTDRREYCRLYSERLQDWCMNEGAPS